MDNMALTFAGVNQKPSPSSWTSATTSTSVTTLQQTTTTPLGRCFDWQFQCANGECIPHNFVCDKLKDCTDGSDENFIHARCTHDWVLCLTAITMGLVALISAAAMGVVACRRHLAHQRANRERRLEWELFAQRYIPSFYGDGEDDGDNPGNEDDLPRLPSYEDLESGCDIAGTGPVPAMLEPASGALRGSSRSSTRGRYPPPTRPPGVFHITSEGGPSPGVMAIGVHHSLSASSQEALLRTEEWVDMSMNAYENRAFDFEDDEGLGAEEEVEIFADDGEVVVEESNGGDVLVIDRNGEEEHGSGLQGDNIQGSAQDVTQQGEPDMQGHTQQSVSGPPHFRDLTPEQWAMFSREHLQQNMTTINCSVAEQSEEDVFGQPVNCLHCHMIGHNVTPQRTTQDEACQTEPTYDTERQEIRPAEVNIAQDNNRCDIQEAETLHSISHVERCFSEVFPHQNIDPDIPESTTNVEQSPAGQTEKGDTTEDKHGSTDVGSAQADSSSVLPAISAGYLSSVPEDLSVTPQDLLEVTVVAADGDRREGLGTLGESRVLPDDGRLGLGQISENGSFFIIHL